MKTTTRNSNTTNVKVKRMGKITNISAIENSNTTNVKVKQSSSARAISTISSFKYNQC